MSFKSVIHKSFNKIFKIPKTYHFRSNVNHTRFYSSEKQNKASTLKLSLVGASIGVLVGTGYSIKKLNQPHTHIANEEIVIPIVNDKLDVKPSRRIIIPDDKSGLKITLYQYQTCPFCCKVRAFLDYYGISYDVVEVDPVLRQSIRWSEYKKVPILLAQVDEGYQQLNDSTMIISALQSFLADSHKKLPDIVKCYPLLKYADNDGMVKNEIMNRYFLMLETASTNSPNSRSVEDIAEERKWRKWTDDVLVHTLSPNVYRSHQEALQAFNWFSEVGGWEEHFPTWERIVIIYVGAFAMWLIGKKLKTRHNLKDDVRQSLYDECNFWTRELKKKGTPFMGGKRPNLSDLAVYGILSSIEGCDAFQDLLQHSNISIWYKAMKETVQNHDGKNLI